MPDELDYFSGNLQAMGGLGAQAAKKKAYVKARLSDTDRTLEWREVEAEDLGQAIKIVEQQDDVEVVLEASWTPGLQDVWIAENKSMAVDDTVPLFEREWAGSKDV